MRIENNNINFSGYKNILSRKFNAQNGSITILSGQLDNVLHPDLDKFRHLIDTIGGKKFSKDDLFTLTYLNIPKSRILAVNDKAILSGEALKALGEGKLIDKEYFDYPKTKDATLEFYTLFANILTRMMNDNVPLKYDLRLGDVVANSFSSINAFLNNEKMAHDFAISLSMKSHYQTLAKDIHTYIKNTMKNFFS